VALPFLLNLIANAAFTPLQFGLKSNALASVDIVIVLVTLVWGMVSLWYAAPDLRWVVLANIPYLLWVSFATVLQLTITYLNA
jgi:tryptophan-rich sensory protein